MKKTLLMGAATALMFMTSNAVAGGTPGFAAPNWTGFYVGLGVGGGFATHDLSGQGCAGAAERRRSAGVLDAERLFHLHNGDGRFFGTVTLGYDQLVSSRWVAGAFVDYDFATETTIPELCDWAVYRHSRVEGKNHAWSIGGRLGVLSSPSTLCRLRRLDSKLRRSRPLCHGWWHPISRSFDKDRDGWFVGAGIETQLGRLGSGLSLRGEYRFSQLDHDDRRLTLSEGLLPG